MKKTLIILLGTVFLLGCKTNQNQITLSEKLTVDFPKKEQLFSFNNGKDTVLVTENNTRFSIPAYTFCNEKDTPCLNSNIEIKIVEYYKLSDMILARLGTLSDNQIIETAGMFELIASKNQNHNLLQHKPIIIELPSRKKNGFIYFKGMVKKNNFLNWIRDLTKEENIIVSNAKINSTICRDTSYNNIIKATELGWINCDKFLKFPDTTTLFVKTENDMPKDALFSVVMKNYNSIIPGIMENGKIKFSPMPNNEPVILFILYHDGESYYLDMKEVVISKDTKYELNPVKVTKEELEAKLSKLNKNRDLTL